MLRSPKRLNSGPVKKVKVSAKGIVMNFLLRREFTDFLQSQRDTQFNDSFMLRNILERRRRKARLYASISLEMMCNPGKVLFEGES